MFPPASRIRVPFPCPLIALSVRARVCVGAGLCLGLAEEAHVGLHNAQLRHGLPVDEVAEGAAVNRPTAGQTATVQLKWLVVKR